MNLCFCMNILDVGGFDNWRFAVEGKSSCGGRANRDPTCRVSSRRVVQDSSCLQYRGRVARTARSCGRWANRSPALFGCSSAGSCRMAAPGNLGVEARSCVFAGRIDAPPADAQAYREILMVSTWRSAGEVVWSSGDSGSCSVVSGFWVRLRNRKQSGGHVASGWPSIHSRTCLA